MKKRYSFRVASLNERKEFYEKEFSMKEVMNSFKGRRLPQICAVDAGSETGIIKNKKWNAKLFYFELSKLKEKIKKYLPEDVYYDRNHYENPKKELKELKLRKCIMQELVFDVDSDNIRCNHGKKEHACRKCLGKAYKYAMNIKKALENEFDEVAVIYSGRGFHVHVFDEKAFSLGIKERAKLNKKFSRYAIDEWVSRGNINLIRMPYTLNAVVSRKVVPVTSRRDREIYLNGKSIPWFLKD